jgi:hypothetical protein
VVLTFRDIRTIYNYNCSLQGHGVKKSDNRSPNAASTFTAEDLSTGLQGVRVLILSVVRTTNLVFYSCVKSKCTGKKKMRTKKNEADNLRHGAGHVLR